MTGSDLPGPGQVPALGRPRSETARHAVLHAVDDLLVEVGYAAMTMKGIAARAGVGRQTVYRWWSTKAEILLEACVDDASSELRTDSGADARAVLLEYLSLLARFLTESPAGLAFRALLGEAQHDAEVRRILGAADVLGGPTGAVLQRARPELPAMPDVALAAAELYGPVLAHVLLTGVGLTPPLLETHVDALVRSWA